jgi:hypothetical protein
MKGRCDYVEKAVAHNLQGEELRGGARGRLGDTLTTPHNMLRNVTQDLRLGWIKKQIMG